MDVPSQLTYTGVLLAVLANQLCLPVPGIIFLMAAGALSAQGYMQAGTIILLSVLACVVADGMWFWLGRKRGSEVVRLLCSLTSDPRKCSRDAHEKFRRYGFPLVLVAKFLPGFDGLLPPLAGAEGVSAAGFLALDGLGSLLWAGFYVGIGYFLSGQLESVAHWVEHFGRVVTLGIGIPLAVYAGWRGVTLIRMIRRLRVRRMSALMLHRKLESGSKIALLDLLDFEQEAAIETRNAIPGALRLDPSRLGNSPRIAVPDDVEVVLYCSSRGDIVSARAAVALERIGVENVWVLDGGIDGWRERGLPVSPSPASPEAVGNRLGVRLPNA